MAGVKKVCAALALMCGLSTQLFAAPTEPEFLAPFKLKPGAVVRYLDEGGQSVSYAKFVAMRAANPEHQFVVQPTPEGVKVQMMNAEMMAKFNQPEKYKVSAGAPMPDFTLKDLQGKTVDKAALAGRYALMSFYFAECKPCVAEVPALNVFKQKNPHLHVLAVTFDDAKKSQDFVREYKLDWTVLPEATALFVKLGVKSFPSFALLNPEGKLLGIKVLGQELDAADMAAGHPHLSAWVKAMVAKDKAG